MQSTGQITTPTGIVTLASPVYYTETVTALTASTTGALTCSPESLHAPGQLAPNLHRALHI